VWGQDREQARHRLLRSLDEFVLEGPRTNLAFHRWLAAHPAFAAGELSTRFLEQHFSPETLDAPRDTVDVALFAAALHAREERLRVTVPDGAADAGGRSTWKWARRSGGR
jgi:acetyl/propionyl-CoA carboxylase alpha subunit